MALAQANSFVPMVVISAAACIVITVDLFLGQARSRKVCGGITLAGLLIALAALLVSMAGDGFRGMAYTFGPMFIYDQVSVFLALVFFGAAALVTVFSMRFEETRGQRHGEFYTLLLGAVLGALLLVTSDHLLLFVLGLEMLSMCSYILAGFLKEDRRSSEASLKYMIYGAVTSGTLLFGMSYFYGLTGTLQISEMGARLAQQVELGDLHPAMLCFVAAPAIAGLGFKMAMVPFHFWCPDIYQGSPTPVAAFLSIVSKAAGFGAFLRVLLPFYTAYGHDAPLRADMYGEAGLPVFIGLLAIATMTYGNLAALRQTNVKRMMGYSSIAHAGYLLLPLTVDSPDAVPSLLFYLFVYLFMNLGVFWVIQVVENQQGDARLDAFRGAAYQAPWLFVAMFVFLIALTGLPPTAGFAAKLMLLKVVVGASIDHMAGGQFTGPALFYLVLAVAAVLNSAVSLYYYMKIVRIMALEEPVEENPRLHVHAFDLSLALLLAVPTVVLLYFSPVLELVNLAAN